MPVPPAHLFIADPEAARDHKGRHFCRAWGDLWRCALPEDHPVHKTADELLPDTPVEDASSRILGENDA